MKLTTMTQVTVDGVMHGNGAASDEDRRSGFERGGWAMGVFGDETMTFIDQTYQRADAFLFGRRTYELFAGYLLVVPVILGQGTRLFPDTGPDRALELVASRVTPGGVTIQVYRPDGRPRYSTATADMTHAT